MNTLKASKRFENLCKYLHAILNVDAEFSWDEYMDCVDAMLAHNNVYWVGETHKESFDANCNNEKAAKEFDFFFAHCKESMNWTNIK